MRILAFGDSFVAGVGDPAHQGWLGRALAGRPEVTLYNLGVRRDTSADIARRWLAEAVLPWSPRSALRAWQRALSRSQGPQDALARLDALQAARLARDRLHRPGDGAKLHRPGDGARAAQS